MSLIGLIWHEILIIVSIINLNPYNMLRWAGIFFVIAIIAAIFGFGGISEGAAGIAKVLFFIFIVGFVLVLILGGTVFKK